MDRKSDILSALRFFKRVSSRGCETEKAAQGWAEVRCGKREWEDIYRRRWQ